ncbi:type II/IV secretion system protein [Candidatus Uhrbacteria bacterium]|nr:MAG: type II/IV secretion system protein [Candidatus Uhrbacteria bacterium]
MANQTTSIEDLLKKARAAKAAAQQKPEEPTKQAAPKLGKAAAPAKATAQAKLEETMGAVRLQEKERETAEKAAAQGLPYIQLRGFPIAPEALSLLTRDVAETLHAVVFFLVGDEIRIGTTTPGKEVDRIAERIAKERHANVSIYLISEDSLQHALKLYEKLPTPKEIIYGYRIEEEDLAKYEKEISNFEDLQKKITEVSTTDIITLMFGAALKIGTSDVHVEAEEEDVKVRFRIDGRLRDAATLPKAAWKQIIGRLKLLAGVKINVEDVPQDGRITIYLTNEKIDIRVSFLPTAFGESVVMRILRPKAIALEFDNLGIRGAALKRLEEEIEKPNGMIITTGPTGSGKTTTLYAILKKLNSPTEKIITLEDPIEYKLQGINQSQVDHSKGYDFAKGLRSILRQDPDIVMVGEIRDVETAEIAIQAALTGHLVVSTIHTNSAAGAIPRFLSMGVKPFLLAPALNAVIGQRLVRRLKKEMAVPAKLSTAKLKQVKEILGSISKASGEKVDLNKLTFYEPDPKKVTPADDGYKGRVGIYEIFTMTPEIEDLILSNADVSEYKIQEVAIKNGMITMAQDGLLKALDGLTSVDEVLAVANVDSTNFEPLTATGQE